MKTKVILTANPTGQIFTQSLNDDKTPKLDKNGDETGYIRVENPSEADLSFAYNGGVKRGQSALIPMSVKGWEKVKNVRGADGQPLYHDGALITGRVQVLESLVQTPGATAKTTGGDAPQALLFNGQPIFRKTVFDATCELADELIIHNNELVKEPAVALNEPAEAKAA